MWLLPPPQKVPKVFLGEGRRLLGTYLDLTLGQPAQIIRAVLLEAPSSECARRIHTCPNPSLQQDTQVSITSTPHPYGDGESVANAHECIGPSWTIDATITRYIIDVSVDLQ